jgi:MFS family permease
LIPRILFGAGEATYAALGPSFLSEFFPPAKRNVAMAVFYSTIPIGSALGYAIASPLAQHVGWRLTFALAGLPGLLGLFLLLPQLREPEMGESDVSTPLLGESASPTSLRRYIIAVLGCVAVTFGMGGFSDWMPTFFYRYHGMSVEYSGLLNGGIVVIGGLLGTLVGSGLTELLGHWVPSAKNSVPYIISAITMCLGSVLAILALVLHGPMILVLLCFGVATFLICCYNGPINSVIQNSVPANMRSRANGICVLCIHLFGDVISPTLIGLISGYCGLRIGLLIVPGALLVGGLVWVWGVSLPISQNSHYTLL